MRWNDDTEPRPFGQPVVWLAALALWAVIILGTLWIVGWL